MERLIVQAQKMIESIKALEKEIDNPVLTMSLLSELYFLIEHLEEE